MTEDPNLERVFDQATMRILREAPGVQRIIAQRNNRILLDLVKDHAEKERIRLIDLIERLEIGSCEGPEIGYAISRMYTLKIASLVRTSIAAGHPEVGFLIANMLHDAGVSLGVLVTEAMHENKE